MNFFWGNVFEYFKERRHGAIFFGTFASVIAVLVGGWVLYQVAEILHLLEYAQYPLLGVGLLLLVWIWRGVRQIRARRRDRYKISPMSRDELTKARSKLVRIKH